MLTVRAFAKLLILKLACCIGLVLLVSACGFLPVVPESPVGITLEKGMPGIVVVLCKGERVESIRFLTDIMAEYDANRILWEIQAQEASGAGQESFTLGETPPGFREVEPLRQELDPSADYTIEVSTTDRNFGGTFPLAEAREGTVYDGDQRTLEDFTRAYEEQCH